MKFQALHDKFGVEVFDIQLADISVESGYQAIRELFEQHSLLLFHNQHLDDQQHLAFGQLFGPIEDRSCGENGPDAVVSSLSNVDKNDAVVDENEKQLLNLKANQLWHTDSTFLPVPALANILMAKVLPSSGGETEFVSTRVAWSEMPESLKKSASDKVFCHRYAHSRLKISAQLADDYLYTRWSDQRWKSLWRNPLNGDDAIYLASHIFKVKGMDESAGQALIDELVEFATQTQYIYQHQWQVGDVLVWDERATMHRGRPWPYQQARSLSSICISVGNCDGLADIRV